MGIPIARGRDFTDQDKGDSKKVVVISEKTAQHYWPGQDPIGKRLKPGATNSDVPWREVIGVVKDVRQNDFIAQPKMQMYFNYRQMKDLAANALVVRTSVEPISLATSVRNGGFPPLLLDPVDFVALYQQRVAQMQSPQATTPSS